MKGFVLNAIKEILRNVNNTIVPSEEQVISTYDRIPQIARNYCDILIKNFSGHAGNTDLALMYHEHVNEGKLYFTPMLFAINDATILYGHRTLDLSTDSDYRDDLDFHADMTVESISLNIGSFAK